MDFKTERLEGEISIKTVHFVNFVTSADLDEKYLSIVNKFNNFDQVVRSVSWIFFGRMMK